MADTRVATISIRRICTALLIFFIGFLEIFLIFVKLVSDLIAEGIDRNKSGFDFVCNEVKMCIWYCVKCIEECDNQ